MNSKSNKIENDMYTFVACIGLLISETMLSFLPGGIIFPLALSTLSGGFILNSFKSVKWDRIFNNCGLKNSDGQYPELIKKEENEIGDRYTFSMPAGLCFSDFEKLQEEIETALHEPIRLDLTNNYKLIVQIYNIKYEDVYKLENIASNNNKLIYPIGVELTPSGPKNVNLEFNRSNSHMLVCGMTGKGKTVLMRLLIALSMIKKNTEVYICDLKASGSFNIFKNCKNLIELVKSDADTIKILKNLKSLMEERYKILDKSNMSDVAEYNEKYKFKRMKNIILLVEEFVILSKNNEAIDLLNLLLAQASGAGIYIWLTVQRPDAKTLDTRLKSNLSYTIAFKAKNSSNSEVYLDKGDFRAYKELYDKGEALLIKDDEDTFFKAYFLANEEIENLVKHTYIDKSEPVKEEELNNKVIPLKQKQQEEKKVVDLL